MAVPLFLYPIQVPILGSLSYHCAPPPGCVSVLLSLRPRLPVAIKISHKCLLICLTSASRLGCSVDTLPGNPEPSPRQVLGECSILISGMEAVRHPLLLFPHPGSSPSARTPKECQPGLDTSQKILSCGLKGQRTGTCF